jgi:hypothetical protein
MQRLSFASFFVAIAFVAASAERVYVAPHSHCDAGWTSTFEQYYQVKVKNIIPSVIDQLMSQPDAVFSWAEIGFLQRWFEDNDTVRIAQMQQLVQQGRIVWAGGGWVQHDEGSVHYRAAINQMTEGHLFIAKHFPGSRPLFGWQIDPFGHANANALMFALMGFSATVTDRMSLDLIVDRIATLTLEWVWEPPAPWNRLLGETAIFAHQLGLTIYNFPGFIWEYSDGGPGSPPVTDRNVKDYRDLFYGEVAFRQDAYATDRLLVPWGGERVSLKNELNG